MKPEQANCAKQRVVFCDDWKGCAIVHSVQIPHECIIAGNYRRRRAERPRAMRALAEQASRRRGARSALYIIIQLRAQANKCSRPFDTVIQIFYKVNAKMHPAGH